MLCGSRVFQGKASLLRLGEYCALCAAGVFEFEDAMKLVMIRGLMPCTLDLVSSEAAPFEQVRPWLKLLHPDHRPGVASVELQVNAR